MNIKLAEALIFHNPWWTSGHVPVKLCPLFERDILPKMLSYTELDRIIVLKGPRRTGKTTLMYQMIKHLIQKGIDPKRIMFLSFDDLEARDSIEEIIQSFEQICKLPVTPDSSRLFYFLFDEVHFWENWELSLKKYFDKKYPIKFIVTSSSASISRHDSESLMGRTIEELVLPFSFSEVLLFKHAGSRLAEAVGTFRAKTQFHLFDELRLTGLLPFKKEITLAFQEYMDTGGFPHVLTVNEPILRARLLRDDVIDKVLYRDLVQLYEIRKPQVLEKLLFYLADTSGEILNITNISNSLKLSREYTERYLEYLKQAYLVVTVRRYALSTEKTIRADEKVYVTDSGLLTALGVRDKGKIAESVVQRHFMTAEHFYWRNGGGEVDFVVRVNKDILPVEVKYRDSFSLKELKGVKQFAAKYDIRKAIIISTGDLRRESYSGIDLVFVPIWAACLL